MLKFLKRLFGSDTLPPPGEQIPTGIGYVPLIRSSRTVQAWSLGPHQAKLLTDIQALGHIEYTHALLVYDTNNALLYVVAAEVNSMASMLGGGSHFLGVFDEEGHTTHGSDNAWANLESFRDHALTMASDRFQAQPIALP
ncbi:MAG: hypothetical protein AAFX99_06335 [Myxococcota bacterium]